MAHVFADRVRDTTTDTGTGALTVIGAPPLNHQTPDDVYAVSDTFYYAVYHDTADSEWEVGIATYLGGHQFARTSIYKSSNSNNAVSFTPGDKTVIGVLPADVIETLLNPGDIGTLVQAWHTNLDEWATVNPSTDGKSLVSATNYAAMRALLDLEAGTDFLTPAAIAAAYQQLDASLTAYAALVTAADKGVYYSGADVPVTYNLVANGRDLVGQNYAGMRGLLDLEAGTDFYSLADLASVANAKGSALIGIEDAGSYFSGATIESALQYLGGLVAALDQAVVLKGTWDASAGTFPGAGAAQSGWSYIVSVAGTVNGVAFAVGDRIIAITDNASTGTFLGNWFKADYTDLVSSVAGRVGAVTLTTADITDLTANAISLITAANYAAMRALLDLEAGTDFYSITAANAAFQPLHANLTSWAAITRAAGFDTFVATPSLANLASLLSDEASGFATFLATPTMANLAAFLSDDASGWATFAVTPSLANFGALLTDEASGLITFMTTPSLANLAALLTDEAAGFATFITSPSSANLKTFITDETGSGGALVFATAPVISDIDLTGETDVQQSFRFTGVISPTALAANTDDWAPTGFSTATVIRASASAAYNLTGIAAGTDGRIIIIENVGSFVITLKDETTSTAANRFALTRDVAMQTDTCMILKYDGTTQRWRAVGGSAGGGVTVSATAPGTPSDGDLWYNLTLGGLFVYVNDGSSSQWVETATGSAATLMTAGKAIIMAMIFG